MADDIAQWLEGLGLGQYAQAFAENDIGPAVLPRLTEHDLKELGLSIGHRRTLQAALERLSAAAPPDRVARQGVSSATDPTKTGDAERRQLTVMFVDLVGSTALSRQLDPEDLREVMRRYQDAVAGTVTRYGGHVAKYLGDGVLAYFGWPRAHEDQAERAVRAGLDAVAAVSGLKIDGGVELSARSGIATGQVVVGDLVGEAGRDVEAVSGETPNLAARLQGVAEAGQVVVGETTRRLIGEAFELDDGGTRELKGFEAPVPVWRVVGARATESRFAAAHAGRLTAFVGREHEIGLLLERWERAKRGEGQVMLLSGEAGIGKSRITQSLREAVAAEPHTRLRYQCAPYYASTALYPFIRQFEFAAGFAPEDDATAKLDKIQALLTQTTAAVAELAPLFAASLSVPTGDRYPPLDMSPQRQKEKTLEAIADQIMGLAERQPVLMIFEDAHWADPTSLEALEHVIERLQATRVLAVITFRPEFVPPWQGHTHVTALTLNRLGREQCAAMVTHVTRGKTLPDEVLDQIIAKTDGVPLFVEELTKTIVESGLLEEQADHYQLDGPLPPLAIPSTLQDSLMARLDRLAPVKEVAQVGAAIGREFSHRLLAAVMPLGDNQLKDAITQLAESELIFRRGTGPDPTYSFKHALVQDVAYGSLLRSKRREIHQRIAEALVGRFVEAVETEPEVVAHHYTEAGLAEQAIEYWRQAGERAALGSANVEAVNHFTRALDLLGALPDSPTRARDELVLRIDLGGPLLMTKGHTAPEVERAYARARELCEQVGDTELLVPALFGLWRYYNGASNIPAALQLGEQLLAIGEETGDPVHVVVAHYALGFAKLCHGEPARALAHLEQGSSLYRPEQRTAPVFRTGQDPGVACLVYSALAQWLLGHPDKAVATSARALAFAEELSHPFSQAHALNFDAILYQGLGDPAATRRQATAAIALCTEQHFPVFVMFPSFCLGWALAREGCAEEGAQYARNTLDMFRASPLQVFTPYVLGLYAETCAIAGRTDEAQAAIDEALAKIEEHDERLWEADTLRIKGDLLLSGPSPRAGDAEACFARAIEVAQAQEARWLWLKAAMSLARLERSQGRSDEARVVLEPVCSWFTEGFDTPDLKEAKALLDELS